MSISDFHREVKHRVLPIILAVFLFAGCASYALDSAQYDIRSGFAQGNFSRTQKELNKFKKKKIYKDKDAVLFNLESGMVSHFSGDYTSSISFLSEAESAIEKNYTKSITRGVGAFFVNDNKLVYDGEPYEDIYVNAFNALNYIKLNNFDAALVEARRMSYKMEQLDIKIKGLVDAFAATDSSGRVDWGDGRVNFQNSAMSHYLAAILFAKTNKSDDARIESEKLAFAMLEQNNTAGFRQRVLPDYTHLQNADEYNVLLAGFSGQAPFKSQEDARFYWGGSDNSTKNDFYLKFSYPVMDLYPSTVNRVRVIIDNRETVPLDLIEEMDVVSSKVFKAKQSIIYGRALLRASFKAVTTKMISSNVRDTNQALGDLLDIFGFIGQEATEKADLRGWQTLPGAAWMQTIALPPGKHVLRYEYLNERGGVIRQEEVEIEIGNGTKLELVESIYSN